MFKGDVTYPLHPETTAAVHHLEEVLVFLASKEAQTGNLEVGPEMAHVVVLALHSLGVDLGHGVTTGLRAQDFFGQGRCFWILRLLLRFGFGLGLDKHLPEALGRQVVHALVSGGVAPDIGDSLAELLDSDGKAIRLVVVDHSLERIAVKSVRHGAGTERETGSNILCDVTEVLDLGLQAPVPFVFGKQRVLVEEPAREVSFAVPNLSPCAA